MGLIKKVKKSELEQRINEAIAYIEKDVAEMRTLYAGDGDWWYDKFFDKIVEILKGE